MKQRIHQLVYPLFHFCGKVCYLDDGTLILLRGEINEYNLKTNEKLRSIFDLVAENFESVAANYFTYFGHQLVDRSGITDGQKNLDVTCGRGASLFKALGKIGESGYAVGTDFSVEMIKQIDNIIQKRK